MSYQEKNKADPGYAGYPFQLTLSSNGLPGRWVGGWMDGWMVIYLILGLGSAPMFKHEPF